MGDVATGGLRASAARPAEERLPSEQQILERAPGENFSVASLVLGRDDAPPPARDLRLRAPRRPARRRRRGRPARAARRLRGRPRPRLRRREPRAPGAAAARSPRCASSTCRAGRSTRLIEANRRDQRRSRYGPSTSSLAYCDLSANPVGELVLHVFGAATPDRIALSDRVCTALQLAEHWQDVAEDHAAGRIYLPAEDLDRFGVAPADLGAAATRADAARADGVRGRPRPRAPRRGRAARRPARAAARGSRSPATSAAAAPRSTRSTARGYDVLAGAAEGRRRRRARPRDARDLRPEALTMTAVELAYEHCRRIARESGSSFYAGMRLLPPDRRNALFAVYALARQIDDVADGDAPGRREARRARRSIRAGARARSTTASDPVLVAARRRRARASRSRSTPSASSSTAPSSTSRGDGVRDVRRPRALLPLRRGLDRAALARRLRLLRPRARGARSPTSSASRSRSGTSSATSARTRRTAASTCRARTSSASAASAAGGEFDGPARARDRLRGRARPRPARARPRPRAAARPPQRLVRPRDGREVPPAARADRRRAVARPPRPALAPAVGEGPRPRPQPRPEPGA